MRYSKVTCVQNSFQLRRAAQTVKCAHMLTWVEGLASTSVSLLRPIRAVLLGFPLIAPASAAGPAKETARLGIVLIFNHRVPGLRYR